VTTAPSDLTSAPRAAPNPIDAPGTDEADWRQWPVLKQVPALDVSSWTSAVVLAAHPDDEVLGPGGLTAVLAAAGARLRVVAVTDGEASHRGLGDQRKLARRRAAERRAALQALGASDADVVRLGLPDAGLGGYDEEIAARLPGLVSGFDVCLAPWAGDIHADHEAVGRAAALVRRDVLFYTVWMWHWARPGDPRVPWARSVRVPLPAAAQAAKRAAVSCFASQREERAGGEGPVIPDDFLAHFTRPDELLIQGVAP
jgi:LmbE family N-acetylglucosaminyl deacetylase